MCIRDSNLSVCVDFEYRAVPLFLQTKKIIDENILGKIYLIKLDWLMGSRSDPKRAWNWYSLKEKGPSLEKETGLNFYHDWGKLVKSRDIDGIIIATSPESRFKLAKEALENNKHLLLEKPVTLNCEEIEELQRISLINNLSVCVDFE